MREAAVITRPKGPGMFRTMADAIGRAYAEYKLAVSGQKSDLYSGLTLVEAYDSNSAEIENVESFYKLISKVPAIPKSTQEITQAIVSKDWSIVDGEGKGKEVKNVPEQIRMLIDKPAELYDYAEFVSLLVTDILVSGNVFSYLVSQTGGKASELRRIDPRYVLWVRGKWYENNPWTGMRDLEPEYLVHVKLTPDPFNPRWGRGVPGNNIGLFQSIVRLLDFRDNFYKNGCFPGGVFAVENQGTLGATKTKALVREHQGSSNAGEPIILEGKVTYTQTQLDPTALKVSEEILILGKEVMSAFGMPRYLMELGLRDGGQKYNNHSLQHEHFIKTTVIPVAKKIEAVFSDIVQRYNPSWRFRFDIRAEVYDDETLQSMAEIGTLSPNEHRDLMGIPKSDDELLDRHYLKMGAVPIDQAGASSAAEPTQPETVPPKAVAAPPAGKSSAALEQSRESVKIENGRPREKSWRDDHYLSEPADGIWSRDEIKKAANKARIRQDFINLNAKTRAKKEKGAKVSLRGYLVDLYSNVLAAVAKKANTIDKLSGAKADVDKIVGGIYNEADDLAKLERITLSLHEGVGAATFANTANILTAAVPFIISDPEVAAQLNLLRESGPLVLNTTKAKLTETISAGITSGKTHTEIAKDIWLRFVDDDKEMVAEFSKIYRPGVSPKDFDAVMTRGDKLVNRAELIARTEVANANKTFSALSMQKSGVVKSVALTDCDPCPVCAPYQNVPVAHENVGTISNLHPRCTGTIVPAEIDAG